MKHQMLIFREHLQVNKTHQVQLSRNHYFQLVLELEQLQVQVLELPILKELKRE
jgi:hypothetical protein